jgi:hypothetical protein
VLVAAYGFEFWRKNRFFQSEASLSLDLMHVFNGVRPEALAKEILQGFAPALALIHETNLNSDIWIVSWKLFIYANSPGGIVLYEAKLPLDPQLMHSEEFDIDRPDVNRLL